MKKHLGHTLIISTLSCVLAFANTPILAKADELAAVTSLAKASTIINGVLTEVYADDTDGSANTTVSLEGKKLSVLGDSISTYTGTMPADYNIYYPESGDITSIDQTWWGQVLTNTGMVLCSNDSSANTNVTGNSLALDGSAPGCSIRRIVDLKGKDESVPDVIIIYMGINDFSRSRTLGNFTGPSVQTEGEVMVFTDAYELMLQKIKTLYPAAEIYCCTLMDRGAFASPQDAPAVNLNGDTVADFNRQITAIAAAYGASTIDLYNCGINYTNLNLFTTDGIHPTRIGASVLAQAVTQTLLNQN